MTTPSGPRLDIDAPSRPGASLLRELLVGYQVSQALYVAARLGIADLLRDEPKTSEALARATGSNLDALGLLLRVLVAYGVLDRPGENLYATNDTGRLLESARPDSLWPTAVATGKERYLSWAELLATVRTGRPSFVQRNGVELHDFYAQHPAAASAFNGAMAALTNSMVGELAVSYDFTEHAEIVEVGGGLGGFMAEILTRYPSLRGSIVDLPHVIADATRALPPERFGDRLTLIPGDAREALPDGGDLYFMKMVLCDFPDADALAVLRACRSAIADGGKLLIFDKIRTAADDTIARRTVMSSLNLLVMTGGRERSVDEYRLLLTLAGFDLVDVAQTPALDGEIYRVVAQPVQDTRLRSAE
jgi:hypothetical protein